MPAQWPGNSVTKAAEPDGSGGYRSAIESPSVPTGELAYSAQNGLADGETITVTTDGSGGWDFGPAPSKIATLGFGQGYLYSNSVASPFATHTDPFSGTEFIWDRTGGPSQDSRQVTEPAPGFRALSTIFPDGDDTNGGGYFGFWFKGDQSALLENTKVFISRLSKADWEFINVANSGFDLQILSVDSATSATLSATWSGADIVEERVILATETPGASSTVKSETLRISVTSGTDQVTVTQGDLVTASAANGDHLIERVPVQWKGVRVSDVVNDTGSNYSRVYSSNNNGFYGWPANYGVTEYKTAGAGQPVHKQWVRVDKIINIGSLQTAETTGDGYWFERALCPDQGDGFVSELLADDFKLNWNQPYVGGIRDGTTLQWKYLMWQEYLQYCLNARMDTSDYFVQVGTWARVELADSDSPGTTTEAYHLPPVLADWSANSIKVRLWKALMADYAGKYLHVYDENNVFVGAVAL